MTRHPDGFSLVELLVAIAILGILSSIALVQAGVDRRRLALDAATRRLMVGLERARQSAQRDGRPCALSLTAEGWRAPADSVLPPCRAAGLALAEPISRTEIKLSTNLPESLRFSVNGLVLDGGLVVLSSPGSRHRRCVVVSLPLGVTREGRYPQDPAAGLSSGLCQPLPGAPA